MENDAKGGNDDAHDDDNDDVDDSPTVNRTAQWDRQENNDERNPVCWFK